MSLAAAAEDGSIRAAAGGKLRGELRVPGDKSISHRAALINALADGQASIRGFSIGADCRSTLDCLRRLGVEIDATPQPDDSLSLIVRGRGLRGLSEPRRVLKAGNSGTTTRLLLGILAGQEFSSFVDGDDSLRSRPMLRVVAPLRTMGASIIGRRDGDLLPLAVRGGSLQAVEYHTPVASAQIKSALLLAGLFADGPSTVVEPAASRDHTERMLAAQGVRLERDGVHVTLWPVDRLQAVDVTVPGDTSSAAYWIVLACIHPDARITVRGVGLNPLRTGLLAVLREMGAMLTITNERLESGEPVGDITAESSELRGIEVGGSIVPTMIDEIPLVAVAAMFAHGQTTIRDAAELKVKESDRLSMVARELARLGGEIDELPDGLIVEGRQPFQATAVESHGDHRLAMSLAVAALAGAGATILGAEAVNVSYPTFWRDAAELGASIQR